MGKDRPKLTTPAVPSAGKAIVVGVTDLVDDAKTPQPPLPPEQVVVTLHQGTDTFTPTITKIHPTLGARMFARFELLPPGTYEARAFRRNNDGTLVTRTALPEMVVLGNQPEASVDLFLEEAPTLELLEARFVGDHELLVPTPAKETFVRGNSVIHSDWGDGVSPGTQPFKPEFASTRPEQVLDAGHTRWHPVSYSRKERLRVTLRLRVRNKATRAPRTLARVRLEPQASIEAPFRPSLRCEHTTPQPLLDGSVLTLALEAADDLPETIEAFDVQYRLTADEAAAPVPVTRLHDVTIYVTWDRPTGRVVIHASPTASHAFPEKGDTQSLTVRRVDWAVRTATGADSERRALRLLFQDVKKRGIRFFGGRRYPTPAEPPRDDGKHATELDPVPTLHHFLWLALDVPQTAHCLDLAAAFRMPARILGIGGELSVREIYPWPPWDAQGKRRPVFVAGEPGQGSLTPFGAANDVQCCFFDAGGFANAFEGVLRWLPGSATFAILYAVGERICDLHDPAATPKEMDDRNASFFFQRSADDPIDSAFTLGMLKPPDGTPPRRKLRRPAFAFLANDQQTLFKFYYEADTFEVGDDRQVKGGQPHLSVDTSQAGDGGQVEAKHDSKEK